MFTVNFYIRKKPEISTQVFEEYWLNEHAKLLKVFAEKIGVRVLIKNQPLPEHPITKNLTELFEIGGELYDFVDQWIFNDIEELKHGSREPEVLAAMQALFESENNYIDCQTSKVFMGQEIAQTNAHLLLRATENDDYIKAFYLGTFHKHLPLQAIQLHMNACHGAMSRLSAQYSSFFRYVQQFRIESTFANELIEQRGYQLEENFAGHAELMIPKAERVIPDDYDHEDAANESEMSLEDFDCFIYKPDTQCFACVEHYVIEKKIVVRDKNGKLPVFFSAEY